MYMTVDGGVDVLFLVLTFLVLIFSFTLCTMLAIDKINEFISTRLQPNLDILVQLCNAHAQGRGLLVFEYSSFTELLNSLELQCEHVPRNRAVANAQNMIPQIAEVLDMYDAATMVPIMVVMKRSPVALDGELIQFETLVPPPTEATGSVIFNPRTSQPQCVAQACSKIVRDVPFRCLECNDACYCSAACRAADWTALHSGQCATIKALRKEWATETDKVGYGNVRKCMDG
jgi:hypothetical protein